MNAGSIGILNVGAGDTKLTFDKNNPAECIRSARIVTDMLRRGYALLVETTDAKGEKAFQRVISFREDVCEYIIADLDPILAAKADEASHAEDGQEAAAAEGPEGTRAAKGKARKPKSPAVRAIPASSTRGVAVARSAGG